MTRSSHAGFSLIEVVVAVALLSIAMGLAYGGLDAAVRAKRHLQESGERLAQVQLLVGMLERDLRSAMPRGVRDEYGQSEPALLLAPGRLAMTRAGAGHALLRRRADLERVEWRWLDGGMQRQGSVVLDQPGTRSGEAVAELDGVELISIEALDQQGRWRDQWPGPGQRGPGATTLPRALRWRAEIEGVGQVERLIELPAELQPDAPT